MGKEKITISKDTLWKSAIEDLVEDFLHFFFTPYVDQIDFQKPVEFLDKELEKLFPDAKNVPNRHADKLFKVFLKDGAAKWFLVHVEVQGYNDRDFAFRVFQCGYRIIEKYGLHVTAVAIYTGQNEHYHFTEFRHDFFGTVLSYQFNTWSLKNFTPEQLSEMHNPFARILEIARIHLEGGMISDEQLFSIKVNLVKHLFAADYRKEKIEKILNFLRYYLRFDKPGISAKFEEYIIKPYPPMGIREAILHEVREQGKAIGIEEGLERGLEKGIAKGIVRGERVGKLIVSVKTFLRLRNEFPHLEPSHLTDLSGLEPEIAKRLHHELQSGKEEEVIAGVFAGLEISAEDLQDILNLSRKK